MICSAAEALRELAEGEVYLSRLYTTAPVGCPDGAPEFVNAAASFMPRAEFQTPASLLDALKQLEVRLGRAPKRITNESRLIDLDLIAWGDRTEQSAQITLPHPRAHLRGFVLIPLADVAPDSVLPGQTQTVGSLAQQPVFRADVRPCARSSRRIYPCEK